MKLKELFPYTFKALRHELGHDRRLYGLNISVSPLLEQRATSEQKQRKIDLVDYLFETPKHKVL